MRRSDKTISWIITKPPSGILSRIVLRACRHGEFMLKAVQRDSARALLHPVIRYCKKA
jgi:hypothetical protein